MRVECNRDGLLFPSPWDRTTDPRAYSRNWLSRAPWIPFFKYRKANFEDREAEIIWNEWEWRVLTTVLKGEQWMIQRKRFRNCNIQTSTLEKEAKLPASYQGPNRQNCLLLNDDKLTEPLYSRSSDYVRLKFFQLKFDEIKWYTLSTYECCLSGPGWIFLFFCRFWAEDILTAVCGFVHFFCAIFTVQIMYRSSNCH